jgi:trigger factor
VTSGGERVPDAGSPEVIRLHSTGLVFCPAIQTLKKISRSTPVKSTVETLSPTRVRLAIEVPFAELEPSLKKAYREIGGQINIPGFRKGKVPAQVIDQRVGRGAILQEAIEDAIPQQIFAAVREHDVKLLGRPNVDNLEFADGQPLKFTAEVDVRPELVLPELSSIKVEVDPLAIGESEVDERVNALREKFVTLKTVERAAGDGDFIQLDLAATVDGVEVEGGTATNLSHRSARGPCSKGSTRRCWGSARVSRRPS